MTRVVAGTIDRPVRVGPGAPFGAFLAFLGDPTSDETLLHVAWHPDCPQVVLIVLEASGEMWGLTVEQARTSMANIEDTIAVIPANASEDCNLRAYANSLRVYIDRVERIDE